MKYLLTSLALAFTFLWISSLAALAKAPPCNYPDTIRGGLSPYQYFFLAQIYVKHYSFEKASACRARLASTIDSIEKKKFLQILDNSLLPKFAQSEICYKQLAEAVNEKDRSLQKIKVKKCIQEFPNFEYSYLLLAAIDPGEKGKAADELVIKALEINPENSVGLAERCEKLLNRSSDSSELCSTYKQIDKANPYFLDSNTDNLLSCRCGGTESRSNPMRSFLRLRNLGRTSSPAEPIKDLMPAFIDKSGKRAFEIGPNVVIGPSFSDGLLLVNSSENTNCSAGDGNAQYWLPNGNLGIDASFSDARSSSEGLCAVQSGDKWGFYDHNGVNVVPCKFMEVKPFHNKRAAVRTRTGWGFIDSKGNFTAEPLYSNCLSYYEGLAAVVLGNKIGFIDLNGEFVISPIFTRTRSFSDGLARVCSDNDGPLPVGGYVDKSGKPAIDLAVISRDNICPEDSWREPEEYELEVAQTSDLFHFHDTNFSDMDFHSGLLPLNSDGQVGFIDTAGKFAIKPQFESAHAFSEGLASVKMKSGFGFVNTKGDLVIPAVYNKVTRFSEGLACVSMEKNLWGYIDRTGKLVIPFQFLQAEPFFSGRARIGEKI